MNVRLTFGGHLFEGLGSGFIVERFDDFRAVMIRESFGQPRDLDRMQARQFVARRFQLDRRCVSRQIADVGPVDDFDRVGPCP